LCDCLASILQSRYCLPGSISKDQLGGLSDSQHKVHFYLPKYSPIFVTDAIRKSIQS